MLIKYLCAELYQDGLKLLSTRKLPRGVLSGDLNFGYCPICEERTVFVERDEWLRDFYFCLRCASIPRWRALIYALETHFPNWRALKLHESSPGGASSAKLKAECSNYVASHFFKGTAAGETVNGFRCENLERQTFADEEFDLVITQDVFEHVLDPARAFAEVARTLKQGGAHVFTVPWYHWKETLTRAVDRAGVIEYLEEPDYHGNPIDPNGSLVVTEWGAELCDFIRQHSGLTTTVCRIKDRYRGIDAQFNEVFISSKPERVAASE
jgi:hypothetical protein